MSNDLVRRARVSCISYHLPSGVLDNASLAADYPEWSEQAIESKLGIRERHIADPDETSVDLAVRSANRLFEEHGVERSSIDYVLLCTQSPDYFLPTSACIVQDRLGLPTRVGALDFNLGCSGFVYGLGLAKGLIETGQADRVLLITSETYSKFIHAKDKSVRTLFGDAAAATLVEAVMAPARQAELIGPFEYGTDGRGAENLIVRAGGMRNRNVPLEGDSAGPQHLSMNGPEIFNFTLSSVPACLSGLLGKASLSIEEVGLFFFHQANKYMLENLRRKCGIPPEKFVITLGHCGNTVSSTIPIALADARASGRAQVGMRAVLVGFGVGYSWAAASIVI